MDIQAVVISIIPFVLGVTFIWAKVGKVLTALTELAHVLTAITNALSDKSLSTEEVTAIKKEISEALTAFKAILTK
jgi:hypothetical protein